MKIKRNERKLGYHYINSGRVHTVIKSLMSTT